MPAVSSRSFTPYGMPCSGPRYFPAAISASACLRLRERDVPRERDDAAQLRIELLDPVQVDVRQALGGERLPLDPARQPRHRREGDVGVARRAAAPRRSRCARTRRAPGPSCSPREHRIPARRGRDVRLRARPCAARRAVRAAAPSTAASSPPPSRARPALIVTCASFSASANVAGDTGGPDTGAVPNVGGAPGVGGGVDTVALCWLAAARDGRAERRRAAR